MVKCTILGCGGSNGTPEIGCDCFVCASDNPKNERLRASVLIESEKTKILVDTTPDLREQALKHKINDVDAVLYTHLHADHIAGINDIKVIAHRNKKVIPAYMDKETQERVMQCYGYIFKTPKTSIYKPFMEAKLFKHYEKFKIGDIEVKAFDQEHGAIISNGFRFGDLAYSTDVYDLPDKAMKELEGLDVWIVDCLRYHYAPSHAHLEKTLNWANKLKPKLTVLTHMAHEIEYDEITQMLPENVVAGYDGMVLEAR